MTSQTVVATANILRSLPVEPARQALRGVLDLAPDLVGLQEWGVGRLRLLGETGSVRVHPRLGALPRRGPSADGHRYLWCAAPLGGCVVGAREDRYALVGWRTVALSRSGHADKPERCLGIEPPRVAAVATYLDQRTRRRVSLVSYHLAPGVQVEGRYRPERPLLVARHRHEVDRLHGLVTERLALGHEVYAVGDSNFDGLRLSGLTSAWQGREDQPGTLGPRRKVDDVHGPGPATSLSLLTSGSDHKAVVASRADR